MNKSKSSKSSSDNEEKNNSNLDRSREKEINEQLKESENIIEHGSSDNIYEEIDKNMIDFDDEKNLTPIDIPINECIKLFNEYNIKYLKDNKSLKNMAKDINRNMIKTPANLQDSYSKKVIELIKNMKKSTNFTELPLLPYGNQLTDSEFINLLEKCISYANYTLNNKEIENIKNKLINKCQANLQNIFKRGQAMKDILENALLTILTSKIKKEQDENFDLLKIKYSTATPIINMNFNDKEEYKLDSKEFIDTFCSKVYLKTYKKSLKKFIGNVPKVKKLKYYIKEHFNKYYIYFCELPSNIYGLTIHTGNIYIKSNYLYEYYNEKTPDAKIIIREKIILNIAHELTHALVREISGTMKRNFFIKSNNNNKEKNKEIKFRDKFTDKFHFLDNNESGNILDFNFFNTYYFDNLYLNEAKLFMNIKTIKNMKEYKIKLEQVIQDEKKAGCYSEQVNKFKKLNQDSVSRCFRSTIFGTKNVTKEEYYRKLSDEDDDEEDEDEDSDTEEK